MLHGVIIYGQTLNNPMGKELSKRLYDLEEAAEYLGRSPRAVYDMIRSGKLPEVRIDRRILVDVKDMDDIIEKAKVDYNDN